MKALTVPFARVRKIRGVNKKNVRAESGNITFMIANKTFFFPR